MNIQQRELVALAELAKPKLCPMDKPANDLQTNLEDVCLFNQTDCRPSCIPIESTLRDLEDVYRKKVNLLQKSCKRAQLVFNLLSLLSIVLNLAGTIVGTSMKSCKPKDFYCPNKIALGVLSGLGICLQAVLKLYEYEKKIYFRKLATTQYKQILNKIEAFRRTGNADQDMLTNFVVEVNILEDLVSDVCPLVDAQRYAAVRY